MTNEKGERQTVSRRSALKGIGAGAFVGPFNPTPTVQELFGPSNPEDTVRIPTVKRGDTVLKWKEVPKSWYEHVQHSRKVRENLKKEYYDDEGVRAVVSARWEKTFDGKNGLLIEAEVDTETYDGSLPDSRNGIPIRETEATDGELKNCCYHDDFDPVPGGVAVQTAGGGVGSAGFCVNNADGNRRLYTANHLWGGCEDNTGGQLNQHTDEFGTVKTIDKDTDYALVKPTSTEGLVNEVFVNGLRYTVSGYKTHDGISDLITSGETCYQTGATSCTTEGPITGQGSVKTTSCYDFEDHGIKADIAAAEGDSGGPFVDLVEFSGTQYAAIISHLTWGGVSTEICCHWGCGGHGKPNYGPAFHNLTNSPHNLSLC